MKHSDKKTFDFFESEKETDDDKEFMTEKYVLVRLYVIDATNIPKGDELE